MSYRPRWIIECNISNETENTTNTLNIYNINWRDVHTKNVVNNVDMSCLRAPWQNGPYKN